MAEEAPHKARTRKPRTAAYVAAALGILTFIVTALAVSQGWTEATDREMLLSMRSAEDVNDPFGPEWFEEMMAEITALGGYTIIIITTVIVIGVLYLLGKGKAAAFVVAALVSGSLLSTLLKQVFSRPRPDVVDHIDKVFTSSFPSAHAMFGTLAWLTLAAVAIRYIEDTRERMFVLGAAVVLSLLISASRVYLGVHWPSDILAGWSLGVAWAAICWLVLDSMSKDKERVGDMGTSKI